jgi:hypothetical protein
MSVYITTIMPALQVEIFRRMNGESERVIIDFAAFAKKKRIKDTRYVKIH